MVRHFLKEIDCFLPLLFFLARTDRGIAADHIGRDATVRHFLKEIESLLPLPSSPARTDSGIVADHIGQFTVKVTGCHSDGPFRCS